MYIPRLIGLFGLKNLYSSAVIMTVLLSIYAYSANPDAFTPMKVIIGFITTALPLMLVMWLAILLSKNKNNPNQGVDPTLKTPVDSVNV